jgi:hypothetical protein
LWGVAALIVVGLGWFVRSRRKSNRWTLWVAIIVGIAFVLTIQALLVEVTDLLYLHHGQSIE